MINFNSVLFTSGSHILVVYNKMEETVAKMVLQYYDTEMFDGTVFVLKVLTNEYSEDIDFRGKFPGWNKYIYYQLDHLIIHPEYMSPEHISQFDEIWDFALENTWQYPEEINDKVYFMPLRYVNIPKIPPQDEYKFDIGFIGSLTTFRFDWITKITQYKSDKYCRVKVITGGVPYSQLYDEVADCKYLLNIPRSGDDWVQNHQRIFEYISSGKAVISKAAQVDNFEWLIKKVERYRDIYDAIKDDPQDMSETYKEWTGDDISYEEYRKAIYSPTYKPRLFLNI